MFQTRTASLGKLQPGFDWQTVVVSPNATDVAFVARVQRHERAVLMPWETDWQRDVVPKLEKTLKGEPVVQVYRGGTLVGEYQEAGPLLFSPDGRRLAFMSTF